ncbi:hypothetical protein TSAR_015419 [Trichomalopsis sarcophagae]|uniref:Uncharacterized protein n=1 Tax=Trichomalopsis sarcophagae TaxID=543379 RepID=A0A232EIY3_9HYME|nr:hypothetical protein TSAR_015419 [Trichomalopsis sarcophagae]
MHTFLNLHDKTVFTFKALCLAIIFFIPRENNIDASCRNVNTSICVKFVITTVLMRFSKALSISIQRTQSVCWISAKI